MLMHMTFLVYTCSKEKFPLIKLYVYFTYLTLQVRIRRNCCSEAAAKLQCMALPGPVPNFCMTRPRGDKSIEFHVMRAPARRLIGNPNSPAPHRSAERLDVRRGGAIFLHAEEL